jgi:hypothetical protein
MMSIVSPSFVPPYARGLNDFCVFLYQRLAIGDWRLVFLRRLRIPAEAGYLIPPESKSGDEQPIANRQSPIAAFC